MAHLRQSRPDFGLGFQVKALNLLSCSVFARVAQRPQRLRQRRRGATPCAGGNNLQGFKNFRTKNGSSQGQNLALTGSFVPNSLAGAEVRRRVFWLHPALRIQGLGFRV